MSFTSIRSWLENVGPSRHLQRMWSMVYRRLSTADESTLMEIVSQCFLERVLPLGRFSLGHGRASLGVQWLLFLHFSNL